MAANSTKAPAILLVALASFGLFLACLYVVSGNILCTPQQQNATAEENTNSDCRVYESGNIFTCPKLIGSLNDTSKSDDKSDTNQYKYGGWTKTFLCESKLSDIAIALFTYCLILVGYFQAFWLQKTVDATLQAANAAKDASEHIPRVERAYIFGGPYDINVQPTPDKLITAVGICVVNHGKTPGVVQNVYGEFSTTEPLGKPVYLHGESRQLYISIKGNSGPNPDYLPVRFDPPIVDYHFFFGYVEYVDIFRIKQTSRFCAKISTYEETRQWEITGAREWNDWT